MTPQKKTTPTPPSPTQRFRKQGQSLVEYTLILGSLSLAVWGTLMLLGDSISDRLIGVSDELSEANTSYFTRFNLSVTPVNSADKTDANSNFGIPGMPNLNPFNNKTQGKQKPLAPSILPTRLTLRNTNGGEMNVSSIDGTTVGFSKANTIEKIIKISQRLSELAPKSESKLLENISGRILLSAALQASYMKSNDHPPVTRGNALPSTLLSPGNTPPNKSLVPHGNAQNEHLTALTDITSDLYVPKELDTHPARILNSIENWNENIEKSIESINTDKNLTADQKTQAISLVEQVIQLTRDTYDFDTRTDKALNDKNVKLNGETINQLHTAAEGALNSDIANQALKTSLTNGITIKDTLGGRTINNSR